MSKGECILQTLIFNMVLVFEHCFLLFSFQESTSLYHLPYSSVCLCFSLIHSLVIIVLSIVPIVSITTNRYSVCVVIIKNSIGFLQVRID